MKKRDKVIKPNDKIKVFAYKHDQLFHRSWDEIIVIEANEDYLIGILPYNTKVLERQKVWKTREPAIVYFDSKHWFNVIAMLTGDGVNYYCNLASPYVYENNSIKYIDYDLDIKVKKNLNFKVVDVGEFNRHKESMNYPDWIQDKILEDLEVLKSWITNKNGPFNPGWPYYWYGVWGQKQPIIKK